jgi:hypothetical protein
MTVSRRYPLIATYLANLLITNTAVFLLQPGRSRFPADMDHRFRPAR